MPLKDRKKREAYIAKWRKANPSKVRGYYRSYEWKRAKNPVLLASRQARAQKYRKDNPEFVAQLQAAYYRRNAEVMKTYRKNWWDKMTDDVRRLMGAKCVCCGERQPEFLEVDHVNNDGYKHRTKGGHRNPYLYYREILEAFRSGKVAQVQRVRRKYQLLCGNCNKSKRHRSGLCVHQRKNSESASE
jgi:hypothetical protein